MEKQIKLTSRLKILPYWGKTTLGKSSISINKLIRAFLLLFCLSALLQPIFAQTRTVSGNVTGSKGENLAGVTVTVRGTKNTTVTKADGSFTLNNVTVQNVLVFSYVGYVTTTQVVGSESSLSIVMQAQTAESLDDVVVVGYGTQRKGSVTGAVASVNSKTFQDRGPIANPLAALQGQVPGVAVTRGSAQPGREGWNFQIRGATSVGGAEPLIIVDGLPLPSQSALNSFNPNDIDNISFLKDGAAAIYGARAAGGVVLITTKKARSGKLSIDYNGSISIKKVGLQPELVDINGWGPMVVEARKTDGYDSTDAWYNFGLMSIYAKSRGINYVTRAQASALGYVPSSFTDVKDFPFFDGTMQDYLWGNVVSNEHQLAVSSRNDRGGYRISLGYLNDGSLLQFGTNSNNRYNVRLHHDYQLSSKLKLESNISLERNDIVQPTGLSATLNNGTQPGVPPFGITGKPYLWGSGIANAATPGIAQYGGDNKENNSRLNANFNLTYNISKNLRAVGTVGYYYLNTDYRTASNIIDFYDITGSSLVVSLAPDGSSRNYFQRASRTEQYYNGNVYLEYSKRFGTDHDFKIMAGTQYERDSYNRYFAKTLDVLPGVPGSLSNGVGDATTKTVGEAASRYALSGQFSRLNYAYKNKYLVEANFRSDGSSRFAEGYRFNRYYGVQGGWRVLQESFMKNITFLNELKIRASYGKLGNALSSVIGNYDYIQFLNVNSTTGPTASAYPILGTAPVVRVSPAGIVDVTRTWENIYTTNLGVDVALLKNRLTGSFDYYWKHNNNMLIPRTAPAVLGATPPAGNVGDLKTWGWEAVINWNDKIGSSFSYHIGGNISDSKNELMGYAGNDQAKLVSAGGFYATVEGQPLNSYYGLVYAGRIQDQKTLDDYKKLIPGNTIGMPSGTTRIAGLQIGDNMYKDLNGDGKITNADLVNLGSDIPRYTFGINGGASWKGFDVNFIFQGVGKRTIIRTGNWRIPMGVLFQAQNAAFQNKWWTPERTDAYYPRISTTGTINNYNYYASDFIAEDGAYLRLKNLVIGYTLPQSITQKAKLSRARIYFSGNDLWEISNIRDGWDPEASRGVGNSGEAVNNNVATYSDRFPFYRYYTVGVNLTF